MKVTVTGFLGFEEKGNISVEQHKQTISLVLWFGSGMSSKVVCVQGFVPHAAIFRGWAFRGWLDHEDSDLIIVLIIDSWMDHREA